MVERACVFPLSIGSSEVQDHRLRVSSLDLPFVVPTEGLLVASGADDGRLVGLFEQVDYVLLSLCGSVTIESLHSWDAVVEVEGQHCLSSISQEEGCEPCRSVWGRSQALEPITWRTC